MFYLESIPVIQSLEGLEPGYVAETSSEIVNQAETNDLRILRAVAVDYPDRENDGQWPVLFAKAMQAADHEHAILRLMGIGVPDTDWYLYKRPDGITQALAHTAIIEGEPLTTSGNYVQNRVKEIVRTYEEFRLATKADCLWNIDAAEQYLVGRQKGSDESPRPYLVDIEPLLMPALIYPRLDSIS